MRCIFFMLPSLAPEGGNALLRRPEYFPMMHWKSHACTVQTQSPLELPLHVLCASALAFASVHAFNDANSNAGRHVVHVRVPAASGSAP